MKRKGFTLIELLAVIVILAIIALIATPIVLDIIEDSKNSSIKRSAELYLSAVEQAIATSVMNGGLEDGTYIIDSKGNLKYKDKTIKVDVKNYNFESGTIIIEQGQIKDIKLSNNEKVTTGKELNKIDKWDGKTVTEVTEDSNGIYHITKASELAWVAQQVNSGETFEGKTISLDASLDLGGRYDKDGNKLGTKWIPIGASSSQVNSFKGTFEGNNNVISGIYIKKLTSKIENSYENVMLGLFGYIDSAIINNLIIMNSYVEGYADAGIFIGFCRNSNINNIVILNSTIYADLQVGLVVGLSTSNDINNIYVYDGKVKGKTSSVGGAIGEMRKTKLNYAYGNSTVENSGTEELSATGGIVGVSTDNSSSSNLISEAIVVGNSGLGEVIGQFQRGSTLTDSVSYAKVNGTGNLGGVIGVSSGTPDKNVLNNIKSYSKLHGDGEYIGGIIGLLSAENDLINIYSKSEIKGKNKVGGVIGGFYDNRVILNYKNLISESTLEGETNVGELWGYADPSSTINKLD